MTVESEKSGFLVDIDKRVDKRGKGCRLGCECKLDLIEAASTGRQVMSCFVLFLHCLRNTRYGSGVY